MSIRHRLLLAFLGVLIPYLALVAIGVVGLQALSQRIHSIERDIVLQLEGTTGLQIAIVQLVMPANDYLITGDPAERDKFERILAQVRQAFARVEAVHGEHPEHPQLAQVRSQVASIEALSREILAAPDPRGDRAASAKMKALDELGDEAVTTLTRLREIDRREILESIERTSGLIWRVTGAALAALVLSAAGGVVLALLFSRWIGYPLQTIAGASHAMAQGDLSQRVDTSSGGELAETARAFNLMAERLEASHAALRRTNEESETRRRQTEALAAIGRDLVQSLDLAVVGERIVESVRTLLHVRFSALYRLESGSGDLVVVAASQNVASIIGPGLVFPKGTGAIGLAVKDSRLVVSEDVLADPRVTFTPEVRARVEQASFRAIIALPLLGKEGVIGVLGIGDEQGRVFDAEEIELAQAFADQAALALQNAGLYAESEARRRAAEALEVTARDLAQSLDPAEVFQRITDSIRRLLASPKTTLYRLEPESGDLRVVAASGAPAFGAGIVFPRGGGAVGLAVELRGPVVSENALTDPRLTFTPEARARVEESRFRAVLAVPLVVKERVIGGIGIRDQEGRVFTAEEVRLAQAFADQAALSLENARLFDEAQRALADLKAAQEQLVQGATMRALGELASGAAHHLNNLMAIVLGRVRLLLSGPESVPLRRPLEVIERAAVDASEVVRRISRFARMKPMEEWQSVDLMQLAAEVLEMTRARWEDVAQAQGIRIEATLEGQGVPPVAGNPVALRELLLNLVLNAVDALPNGGRITLRAFCEDGWAGLAVADTGVGMSREVRDQALEPFFTTKGPRSTGLGLSESYGILQRHGGKLTIESAEGQGTTVTFRLPVHASPIGGRPGMGAEPVRAATRALTILIIDDDDEVREVVVEMLAAQGHRVLQASGGREGLALLEGGEKMDLVLTDLGMPGMTGWDVARAVRARWPGLPVGMLTGWGEQIDESSADRQMVAGVLVKPATPESLQEFIAACPGASRGT